MRYLKAVFFNDKTLYYTCIHNDDMVPVAMWRLSDLGYLHLWAPLFMLKGDPTEENILQAVMDYHQTLKCDSFNPLVVKCKNSEHLNYQIKIGDPFQHAA